MGQNLILQGRSGHGQACPAAVLKTSATCASRVSGSGIRLIPINKGFPAFIDLNGGKPYKDFIRSRRPRLQAGRNLHTMIPGLASLAKGRKNCGKTNSEGQFGGKRPAREQKSWTQSHVILMELRDV